VASVNREALRSQFSRIRATVTRILNDDTTLAERLRTLFREQGVTIASLLTALGFIISTCVGNPERTRWRWYNASTQPDHSFGTRRGRMSEKQLKSLAGWLKDLAGKVAAALAGIIDAIVS